VAAEVAALGGACVASKADFAEILQFCHTANVKATLTITSRGVVTLPAKLRRALGLKADDQLIAETTAEGLLLRPAVTLPIEMYDEKRFREFDQAEAELADALAKRARPKQRKSRQ
jgi:antitoxin PrlF